MGSRGRKNRDCLPRISPSQLSDRPNLAVRLLRDNYPREEGKEGLINESRTSLRDDRGKSILNFALMHYLWFQYTPLVEKAHEDLVHHVILYECASTLSILKPQTKLSGVHCYSSMMPRDWESCLQPVLAWARGSKGKLSPKAKTKLNCRIIDSLFPRWKIICAKLFTKLPMDSNHAIMGRKLFSLASCLHLY